MVEKIDKNLEEIIEPALRDLKSLSTEAVNYLISLVNDDSLEQHQTKKHIEGFADNLLQLIQGENHNAP